MSRFFVLYFIGILNVNVRQLFLSQTMLYSHIRIQTHEAMQYEAVNSIHGLLLPLYLASLGITLNYSWTIDFSTSKINYSKCDFV